MTEVWSAVTTYGLALVISVYFLYKDWRGEQRKTELDEKIVKTLEVNNKVLAILCDRYGITEDEIAGKE